MLIRVTVTPLSSWLLGSKNWLLLLPLAVVCSQSSLVQLLIGTSITSPSWAGVPLRRKLGLVGSGWASGVSGLASDQVPVSALNAEV